MQMHFHRIIFFNISFKNVFSITDEIFLAICIPVPTYIGNKAICNDSVLKNGHVRLSFCGIFLYC